MASKITLEKLKKITHHFARKKILVIGDLMVDRFIRGKVSRISPEAPVPVVAVSHEENVPGGAGNVMINLESLGAEVYSCGVIGEDRIGQDLLDLFGHKNIHTEGIFRDQTRYTSLKTRVIAEHQQVVRFDSESIRPIPPIILKRILGYVKTEISKMDAVILSDYGKGVISQALLNVVIPACRKHKKPICVDPKIEHFQLYKHVTCITPNLMEALGGMRRVKTDGDPGILDLGKSILQTLKSESVLITRGEDGMSLFEKNRHTHIPAQAKEVFDVTGAGDTVISVLTLALAAGASKEESARIANIAAGIVVGKLGTATVTVEEIIQKFSPFL